MCGKIWDYEAKTIRNDEIKEGMERNVSMLKNLNIPHQTIQVKI